MFYCENCNHLSKPGQGANKVVIAKRNRTYENKPLKPKDKIKISYGWEIVKEILACSKCATEIEGLNELTRR